MNNNSAQNTTKRKYRFNLIDLLLVILCVAIIVGCIYVFSPNFKLNIFNKKESVNIQYVIEIQGVYEDFIEKIKENDNVIDSVSKNSLGTVMAVDHNTKQTILSYTITEEDANGVLVESPNKYNVIVTISAPAEYENGVGYSVNSRRIAVGEHLALRFPDYTCECYCIAISII